MPHVIVVGAGPGGASLAFVLADRGVDVTLVERQRDFAREFRGEVLMPSGIHALEQMGLGEALRAAPRWQPDVAEIFLQQALVARLELDPAWFDGHPPLAISQTGLLEAIVAAAAARPGFRFLRAATARELLRDADGRIDGVRVQSEAGSEDLRGDLVVGSDGRASIVRRRGGFEAVENAPPMDIVWCKVPPLPGFRGVRGYVGGGHLLIAYHTWGDQLQLGWAIVKKTFGELRKRGIEQWVEQMAHHASLDLAAHLRAHAGAIAHPFLLDVVSDRVTRWSAPGALLLGDAAHTMSPVGGQGLNHALRDAIAAANELVPVLRSGGGAAAVDAAARRVESARLPELEVVQRAQAQPLRVVLSNRWWGEPVRRAVRLALGTRLGRRAALAQMRLFAFGSAPLPLRV
jgi:2-polyprenyl-6-methoxyphenol hydroxylase-like FAD-dependent oxidoreductase